VPGGGRGELLLAGQLQLHWPPGAQHRERDDVLGQHLLLPAEPAADPLGDHPHLVLGQAEHPADLVAGEERNLGGGPQHQPPGGFQPADRGVRLQRDVLHPLGTERRRVHRVGRRERRLRVAGLAVDLGADVARPRGVRLGAPARRDRGIGVQQRRARRHRRDRVGDGGQHLVVDRDQRARRLGGADRLGHDRDHPLAREPDRPVEDEGVVRVVVGVMVPGA
jgi:hypothetical protein